MTFGVEIFRKGQAVLLTEAIKFLRLDGLLTLIAITHGKLKTLTRYPKQIRENVRIFDMK